MKFFHQFILSSAILLTLAGTYSCQQAGGEQTGSELIPDMAHSVAYEANVNTEYSLNSWDEESVISRRALSQPRLPVNGTIPRGYSSIGVSDETFASAEEAVRHTVERMGMLNSTPNGSVPYYYPDTEDGRNLAIQQLKYNPFPITKDGIARGQELYNIYCGSCHGEKGDGAGYLVRDNGGKYPAQPANFLLDDFVNSSNGRYYHAIMFGKNAMGSHADKISYEERWQVIHFIRSLQAKEKKLKYSSETNTLNAEYGVPGDSLDIKVVNEPVEMPAEENTPAEDAGHQEENDGGHGH